MVKTLREYLAGGGVFSLMTDSHITPVATELDIYLNAEWGERLTGKLIGLYYDEDIDDVSPEDRATIANIVWLRYKEKWSSLFELMDDATLDPLSTGSTTTVVTYGKTVNDVDSGTDTTNRDDTIAGFDSSTLVPDNSRETSVTYGKEVESSQSGEDTIEVTSRSEQATSLVDKTLQFYEQYGLFRLLAHDAANALSLKVYR